MTDTAPTQPRSASNTLPLAIVALIVTTIIVTLGVQWALSGQAVTPAVLGATAAIAVLASGIGLMIANALMKPVRSLSEHLSALAEGTPVNDLPETQREDAFGGMAKTITQLSASQFSHTLSATERRNFTEDLSAAVKSIEAGDLAQRLTGDYAQEFQGAASEFNKAMNVLESTFGRVVSHADEIKSHAHKVGTTTGGLSERTENQAATLEESSAAIEELAASVVSTAEGAKHADELVGTARSNAEASGLVMDQAVDAMKQIETSSAQIFQVVSVIDDIAFQTNLLALNASVEAARAGDAGRGFAVVASEVRALAQRSSDAAKEIESLMSESANHVSNGVQHVNKAVDTLRSIAASVTEISGAVSTIATSAQEQSLNISEINAAMSSLDQATQQTAGMVSDSAALGTALTSKADALAKIVGNLGAEAAPAEDMVPPVTPISIATPPLTPKPVIKPSPPVERYVATQGNAALKADDSIDSDWVEF